MPICSPCPEPPASQPFLTCALPLQVPRIYWELSTKRVLLMEFVDGGQVNDRHYMEQNKIDVNEVSRARSAAGGGCPARAGVSRGGLTAWKQGLSFLKSY